MISKNNLKTNKIISQQRAQAIIEYLHTKGISNERIKANGYAKYRSKSANKKFKKNKEISNAYIDQWTELHVIETRIRIKKTKNN